MKQLAVLLVLLSIVGGARPASAQQLPVGRWTGTSVPPGMSMEIPMSFDVSYEDGNLKLFMNMPGGPVPRVEARDIELDASTITWMGGRTGGMSVRCSVEKKEDGSYGGECVNADDPKSEPMLLTMIPPREP